MAADPDRQVIDQMLADGASHEQIMEFVRAAAKRRRPAAAAPPADLFNRTNKEKPYWTEPQPDRPLPKPYKAPPSRGNHPMEPWEERNLNSGLAGTAAGVALGPLFGSGLAGAALTGAGSGEVEGLVTGLQEGKRGGDLLDTVAEHGAGGALTGAGTHLAGEGAALVGKGLRAGKGMLSRYLNAKDAGRLATAEMEALPKGAEGIQEAAEQGHRRILARDAELGQQATKNYQAALNPPGPRPGAPLSREQAILESMPAREEQNALLSAARGVDTGAAPPVEAPTAKDSLLAAARRVDTGEGAPAPVDAGGYQPPSEPAPWPAEGLKRPVDRDALIANLQRQRAKNIDPDTGQPLNKAIDARFAQAIADLGPEGTTNTVGGTLKRRRALGDEANFSSPAPTPEQVAARKAYGGMRAAVREAAPDIAAADDAYAAHARQATRRRDILYNTERPVIETQNEAIPAETAEAADAIEQGHGATAELKREPQMRASKEEAGTTKLMRVGDKNVPGLKAKTHLQELAAQDTEFAAALDFIHDKKAIEAVRFGTPHLPTDLKGAAAHIGGVPLRYIPQNLRAIGAHIIDPAAQAAAQGFRLAEPFSGVSGPPMFERLLDARSKAERRRQEQADFLLNGGR